ncbi:hypothetical protein VHEMI01460 [[Torrubiella] hemipterigena]|nr:hypothetical protein VHEMI01460 [[Torrubiella] hemipterigena]
MFTVHQNGSPLVCRKLVSALSTFYLQFSRLWPHFLNHLIACFETKQSLSPLTDTGNYNIYLSTTESTSLIAAVEVTTHILEDFLRLDLGSASNAHLHENVLNNAADIAALITTSMDLESRSAPTIIAVMKCLQAYVVFIHRNSPHDHEVVRKIRPAFSKVIECLTNDTTFEAAVELLSDSLANYSSLLTTEQYGLMKDILVSPWASRFYETIIGGNFEFEGIQLAMLLVTLAETKMEGLLQTTDATNIKIFTILSQLLSAEGVPAVDDKIFVPVVEFWSAFAEMIPDFPAPEAVQSDYKQSCTSVLLDACGRVWAKTAYPSIEEYSEWDSSDRTMFNEARKDVIDLLQSVYVLVGPELIVTFVNACISALGEEDWRRLEAAAYCLGGLSDCCKDDDRCDKFLSRVFESSLFAKLRTSSRIIPVKTRQTCLALIEQYTEYFERNPALLPPVLELLFAVLDDHLVASTASKSVLRLCSSCRNHLGPQSSALLGGYQQLASSGNLDCTVKEKVLGALACIAQALTSSIARNGICNTLLDFVCTDLLSTTTVSTIQGRNSCCQALDDEQPDLHRALKALRCLVSISKGFKAPVDAPVDIDSTPNADGTDFALNQLQKKIVGIIVDIQEKFNHTSEVIELICSILRSGFTESEPGPFVLPPSDVAHYLVRHIYTTPRIGLLISTSCSFLSSLRNSPLEAELSVHLLLWVASLLKQMPDLNFDPELVQNAVEFLTRLFQQQPGLLLNLQPTESAEFLFLASLQVLDGKEPLPRAAAAEFWATFVNFRTVEEELQTTFNNTMQAVGPLLCQSLVNNMGGNASRSELDRLTEPLKKLVSRHIKSKIWLGTAMNHDSFPSKRVTEEEKATFVRKVIGLRGSRATNQLVREFWLSCRGSHFAYAS